MGVTPQTDLDEWIDAMTLAENLIKVRRDGLVYIEASKLPIARDLAKNVDVDLDDWIERYFDYDHYA